MEISELKTFITVAETTSFSLAAKHLYLTQPAVSKRVTALEEQLATKLFDRVGRKVCLTEAGKALLPKAYAILKEIDESRRMIANLSSHVRGRLSLGTSHHIGLHRLPPILRAYISRFPDVDLDLNFLGSEAGCEEVERGSLDLAVVTLPPAPSSALLLLKIWDDPLDIVVASDHPLARLNNITLEALADCPAILPTVGTFTRAIIVEPFQMAKLDLNVILETNYLETNKMMVTIGLGWSALPRTMLNRDLCRLTISRLKLSRTLGVVRHKSHTLSNATQALLEMIS